MKQWLIIALLGLTGCNGGSSGDSSSKSLFSVWTSTTTGLVVDLSSGSFGTTLPFTFIFTSGAKCGCGVNIVGSETSGNYVISSCTYTGGGPGDPNCSALNQTGTYSKPTSQLTLCTSGNCGTYN